MNYADIIKKKQKDWDCPELMTRKSSGAKIPFSSPLMNWCTYGGVPRDAISHFYGDYGSGKSTTAQDICKNAVELFQAEYDAKMAELRDQIASGTKGAEDALEELEETGRKKILYIDLEHTYDPTWSATLGLDADEIDVMQPPNIVAEEVLQTTLDIIETGELGLIVMDSIPSLVPKKVLEKDIGESTVAALAGLMTTFMTKVVPLLTRYGCTLILINQIRDAMNNPYAVNTPGGKAVKFYSTLMLEFRLGSPVDFLGNELPQKTENPAGYLINARITKLKKGANDRKKGTYYLMCHSGIRPDFDYTTLAIKDYGLIKKSAAWFSMIDPDTGEVLSDPETGKPIKLNGLGKVYDFLAANTEYYEKLKKYILDDINSGGVADVGTSD